MDLEPIAPEPPMKDVFGGWEDLAAAAGKVASQLPGLGGAQAVIGLLVALLDAQSSQGDLLKSIKADTAALRIAPLKVAIDSLQDARRVGPAHQSWDTLVRRAEAKLSEARVLAADQREAALVEYNRGVVYLMLADQVNASYHLEQSAQCAEQVLNDYARKAKDLIRDARPDPAWQARKWPKPAAAAAVVAGGVVLLGTFGFAGIIYANVSEVTTERVKRKARRDLEDFVGFYNLVTQTSSQVSGVTPPPHLIMARGVLKFADSAGP